MPLGIAMRISTVISSALLSVSLAGCMDTQPPAPTPVDPYTDMPRVSSVSGYVVDPETFFVMLAGWPVDPDDPEGPPPPMLTNGIPYFEFSAATGADVSLVSEAGQTAITTSNERGVFQVFGVPTSNSTAYFMKAEPSASGVQRGVTVPYPSPVEVPLAPYVTTTTLRPIVPGVPLCQYQVATMVSEAGALSALAKARTADGTPTTVADLLNPSKTGGVVLTWVYSPSFLADFFQAPADNIQVEPSAGTLYVLDWAPPGVAGPMQSPMGYLAHRAVDDVSTPEDERMSALGYYAIVLPPGGTGGGPLEVNFIDTTPEGGPPGDFGPRPYFIPPVVADIQPGGVSFARVFSFPGGEEEPPPEETDDEPRPPSPSEDFSVFCFGG
ncbi:hypothetical protein ATI61_103262 [Archangium gephyra]|uniref:Lipoprotein n=2 Tax=Archangium gephyra TaxID=48 RepID=A0ABX9K741_9BACT|nr:hypothetical protein ATI61_103262 [Archangium gephyra]